MTTRTSLTPLKLTVSAAALVLATTVPGPAAAVEAQEGTYGTIMCGGGYRSQHSTIHDYWSISNFNNAALLVTRLRLYKSNGTLVFDSDADDGLPPDYTGTLGPDDPLLHAHESALFWSQPLVDGGYFPWLAEGEFPVQVIIDWRAPKHVIDAGRTVIGPLGKSTVYDNGYGTDYPCVHLVR